MLKTRPSITTGSVRLPGRRGSGRLNHQKIQSRRNLRKSLGFPAAQAYSATTSTKSANGITYRNRELSLRHRRMQPRPPQIPRTAQPTETASFPCGTGECSHNNRKIREQHNLREAPAFPVAQANISTTTTESALNRFPARKTKGRAPHGYAALVLGFSFRSKTEPCSLTCRAGRFHRGRRLPAS